MTTSSSSYCYFINNQFFDNGAGVGDFYTDNCVFQDNKIWGNGVDKEQDGLTNAFLSVGFTYQGSFESGPQTPLNGDPLRGNKYIGNRFMNNGQFGNTHIALPVDVDAPLFETGLPFLITSVFQNPLLPIPVNANIQETPSIFLHYSLDTVDANENTGIGYFLSLGLPEIYSILAGISTNIVAVGTSITLITDVWQGMPSSTVPIKGYTLHTPGRGEIGPQTSKNFILDNVQSTDVGFYHVNVHFDIGTLLSPPALKHYKSNKLGLDLVV